MNCLPTRVCAGLLAGLVGCMGWSPVWAVTVLQCQVTYAGTTETVVAMPTEDPYRVAGVDIAGRFRYKPVLGGQGAQLGHLSIYVYWQTQRQPVLIQQAKYWPPYPSPGPDGRVALTGEQRLYAGPMERELVYQCALMEVAP